MFLHILNVGPQCEMKVAHTFVLLTSDLFNGGSEYALNWAIFPLISAEQCNLLYCNPPALGRDLAHIIITFPLSDIYVHSLMSATGHTSSNFTQDTCGPSGLPH